MSTPRRNFAARTIAPNQVILAGHFAIGAAGAISTTATAAQGLDPGELLTGGAVVKTDSETGRYTVTFSVPFKLMPHAGCWIQGPADAAFPTTTGSDPQSRNVSTTSFDIQCKRPDTQADEEPASGSVIHWIVVGQW